MYVVKWKSERYWPADLGLEVFIPFSAVLEAVDFISRYFHTDRVRANRERWFSRNKYLFKRYLLNKYLKEVFYHTVFYHSFKGSVFGILKSSACLCLKFLKKKKFAKKERASIRRDWTGTTGSRIHG